MSLVTAGPLSRSQVSPFHGSLSVESNQQVPGSPLSPFFGRLARLTSHLSSPSSGSPLAQVPESGSPLLRQVLTSRKRQRDDTPSPSPATKRARDSPRVPNTIVVVKRAPKPASKDGEQLQVVPNVASPPLEGDREKEPASYQRKLPEIVQDAKPLDLFDGSAGEIFAGREE